tara:strand:+ start:1258 stop:2454 length:1197 start_codon:yes stop_codon:yes gene_type:complete
MIMVQELIMPETQETFPYSDLQHYFASSITEIEREDWNRLAGEENPFTRYEFFKALEISGCTSADTGWQPHHLVIRIEGETVGLVPLFLKTNSYGEYVFDWSWARAYQQAGFNYYPKLISAIPFTPSTGERVFLSKAVARASLLKLIVSILNDETRANKFSSWHLLFPEAELSNELKDQGTIQRVGTQYHWFNRGYKTFDSYLSAMSSRKRKSIRKERGAVSASGIEFRVIEGASITPGDWERFILFYLTTYAVRGQAGYLNKEFFERIGESIPHQLFLIFAVRNGEDIAGSLFFKSKTHLFGRYWGCLEEEAFLHFETCYYQGIDYAISNGFKVFDAGAQGEHKIKRGFEPILTYSNHWLADSRFSSAVTNFVNEEKPHIEDYMGAASTMLPFKKDL